MDYELFGEMIKRNVWFVTRLKSNAVYKIIAFYQPPQSSNIIFDEDIKFTSQTGSRCGYRLRIVVVLNDNGEELVLPCGNLQFCATIIANIYRQRWLVELFFKQIKQNLKIRSFVSTSENTVVRT